VSSMFVDGDARPPRRAVHAHTASMGPSMFVDGDAEDVPHRAPSLAASMGPSMFVDGDPWRSSTA